MQTLDHAQAWATSLSAFKDTFKTIASYNFSEMRLNFRGYHSQYTDVSMKLKRHNDALRGYTPLSLWSGVN